MGKVPDYYNGSEYNENRKEMEKEMEKELPEHYRNEYCKNIPMQEEIVKNLWNPKVQVYDKKTETEIFVGPLYGWPPSKFRVWRESLVTVWCDKGYLDRYPFDRYECSFNFTNMDGTGTDKVKLTTSKLMVKQHESEEFDFECQELNSRRLWNNFYSQSVGCTLKRKARKNVVTFFATTSLVATLSLVSFCVPKDNVPGRLGVLVTLYLLLINTYGRLKVPAKLGFGNLDLWFLLIQVPVLLAIIEYSFIMVWEKYCRQVLGLQTWRKHAFKYVDFCMFGTILAYLAVIITLGATSY